MCMNPFTNRDTGPRLLHATCAAGPVQTRLSIYAAGPAVPVLLPMSNSSADFYRDLPTRPAFEDFFDLDHFSALPDDWTVLVADVRGSTHAIRGGRYRDVNTVGVSCIAAMLNGLKDECFPYVFGGDGATFCVPERALQNARALLLDCQQLARRDFDLDLRVGAVPVSLLRDLDTDVRVGKWQVNDHYVQSMLAGEGLSVAERLIKSSHQFLVSSSKSAMTADFTGFECRWQEIPSPSEENVSLLVAATAGTSLQRRLTYAQVQHCIETIYGSAEAFHPVHGGGLRLALSPVRMASEARVRNPGNNRIGKAMHVARVWPLVMAGAVMMARGMQTETTDWGAYKSRLRDNTDFRKFDDVLRLVMAGTAAQRSELRASLDAMRAEGKIAFGMHVSDAALITCIVSDYNFGHVHFLDGADGGYAMAAVELKAQLKSIETRQGAEDAETGDELRNVLDRRRKDRSDSSPVPAHAALQATREGAMLGTSLH